MIISGLAIVIDARTVDFYTATASTWATTSPAFTPSATQTQMPPVQQLQAGVLSLPPAASYVLRHSLEFELAQRPAPAHTRGRSG